MDAKVIRRQKIRHKIRKTVSGTAQRPRLSVFRSNKDTYAQLINDENGTTLASASTKDKDIMAQKSPKVLLSSLVGKAIAAKASSLGIDAVVFDRGGYLYHGRVKAVADGAREAGLKF